MGDLRRRFGALVKGHRKRAGLTQEALASMAELSPDMIARIEAGQTGARFPAIERLADALQVDPAEFFTDQLPKSASRSKPLIELTARLGALSERDLAWVGQLLDAALKPRS